MDLLVTLDRGRRLAVAALAGAAVVGIAWLDDVTGADLTLRFLYLVPIAAAAWFEGCWGGLAASVAAAVGALIADERSVTAARYPGVPFWNLCGDLLCFAVVAVTLSGLRATLARERGLARTDSLTGLANRRWFREILEAEVARSRRFRRSLAVAYLDVDDFKIVNDRLGHDTGDQVLRLVAITVTRAVREVDTVARLGGDEFAILLPEIGPEAAEVVGRRIFESLRLLAPPTEFPVTFSMGILVCPRLVPSGEELLQRADRVMYAVKTAGKASFQVEVLEVPAPSP